MTRRACSSTTSACRCDVFCLTSFHLDAPALWQSVLCVAVAIRPQVCYYHALRYYALGLRVLVCIAAAVCHLLLCRPCVLQARVLVCVRSALVKC